MTGKNATPLIGWHSTDHTLKPWIEEEAERRHITQRELLDEALGEYREKAELLRPLRDAAEARAVNREIAAELRGACETAPPRDAATGEKP